MKGGWLSVLSVTYMPTSFLILETQVVHLSAWRTHAWLSLHQVKNCSENSENEPHWRGKMTFQQSWVEIFNSAWKWVTIVLQLIVGLCALLLILCFFNLNLGLIFPQQKCRGQIWRGWLSLLPPALPPQATSVCQYALKVLIFPRISMEFYLF